MSKRAQEVRGYLFSTDQIETKHFADGSGLHKKRERMRLVEISCSREKENGKQIYFK